MSLSLSADDMPRLLVMVVVAALLGYIADLIAGGRVPLGFFGSILFGLLGAWLAVDVVRPRIPFTLPNEPAYNGVLLVSASIGALVCSLLWCTMVSRLARRWR